VPASLVLATGNQGKVAELMRLLDGVCSVSARPEELPETVEDGDTLEVNARKKAQEVAAFTGKVALADDTGLFVDALEGRPGVYSARYAGPDGDASANMQRLLQELAPFPDATDRTARFVTVVAVVWPDGRELVVEGAVHGTISGERLGNDGFGYDPVFVPDEGDGRSFAQMDTDEKNAISHRSRALAALLARLVSS